MFFKECNLFLAQEISITLSGILFSGDLVHYAVNACLVKLVSLHGTAITTIEGLGSVKVNMSIGHYGIKWTLLPHLCLAELYLVYIKLENYQAMLW